MCYPVTSGLKVDSEVLVEALKDYGLIHASFGLMSVGLDGYEAYLTQ